MPFPIVIVVDARKKNPCLNITWQGGAHPRPLGIGPLEPMPSHPQRPTKFLQTSKAKAAKRFRATHRWLVDQPTRRVVDVIVPDEIAPDLVELVVWT